MVVTPSWFHSGPSSTFAYTTLQGIFTVLAIKEVISVTRSFVKGSSSSRRVRSIILWHMVENWEDLFKICRQLLFPRRMHSLTSKVFPARAPLTRLGWRRLVGTGLIALWLFGVDVSLVVGSYQVKTALDPSRISKFRCTSSGPIPSLKHDEVISKSYLRKVELLSDNEDVAFLYHLELSLNRTELTNSSEPVQLPKLC